MEHQSFKDIKGKICVITGGGGVLGSSMAKGLASSGVVTVILDINGEAAGKTAAEIQKSSGIPSHGYEANVLDKGSLEAARERILSEVGNIEFLVNGAGGNAPEATTGLEQITPEDLDHLELGFFGLGLEGFRKVFDLNFTGTLLPSLVFTRDMVLRQRGTVVNISSMNSYKPLTKIPAYSAAKASVNNFTEWLAVHFARVGVRVNAIAPGFFLTHQNRFLLQEKGTGKLTPRGEKIIASTPMGKFGEPEDLNGALLFLLSDMSRFITGITIPVDGGYSAFGGV